MRSPCRFKFLLLLACALAMDVGLQPCFAATNTATVLDVTITGDKTWVDTGMEVQPGDKLHITAKGTVDFSDKTGVGPEGAARGWKDTLRALSVPSAGRGALVGQIGTDRAATPFLVGADGTLLAPVAGRLYLGVNQDQFSKPSGGKFQVHIDRVAAATAAASGAAASSSNYDFKPLFAELEKSLPSRVSDKAEGGNEGDLVNFVLVGDQEQVKAAFKSAGWVLADKTNQDAVVGALLATLQKQVYVTVPMSTLYLFGRGQDFGYARAQAVEVAAQRDHFRIWKAPIQAKGQVVWAGAGTHDIGIEKDKRSENAITHKIDPEVDKERDFIGATLQQAGWVEAMSYMDRGSNAIKQAFTATGGEIKSDGRVLVIVLKPMSAAK